MHRAIDSARRAFDETDWSTNHELRKRCLSQLQEALEKAREEVREELVLEIGSSRRSAHADRWSCRWRAHCATDQADREFTWRTNLQ